MRFVTKQFPADPGPQKPALTIDHDSLDAAITFARSFQHELSATFHIVSTERDDD